MEKINEKNNNQIASRSKIFMSAILDFCLLMILLTFIFGIGGLGILKNSDSYSQYNNVISKFKEYLIETRLYTLDSDNNIVTSDKEAINYIKKIVKTTYFYENLEFTELNSISEIEVIELTKEDTLNYIVDDTYINDNLAYYYLYYRESILSDLSSEIKFTYGENNEYLNKYNYLFNYSLKANSLDYKSYFNLDIFDNNEGFISTYPENKSIINIETASLLHKYIFLNIESDDSLNIYNDFIDMYNNSLNMAFKELSLNSERYINFDNLINDSQNNIYRIQVLALFISYVISFILYYVIIPLFFKNEKTLGLKFSRLMLTLVNDNNIKFKNTLIKNITLFFTQAISMIIPLVFLGSNLFSVIYVELFYGVRFVYLLIFSFIFSLGSLVSFSINKKHQFLANYLSFTVIKDIDTLKVSEDNKVIE